MTKVEMLMRSLGCTEAEARQVIADDARIDKGEKLFELTEDQKQASKKARAAGRAPGVYKFSQRERKTDEDKRFLIDALVWALTTDIENAGDNVNAEQVEIVNPEREVTFRYKGKKYKIVLSAPRT